MMLITIIIIIKTIIHLHNSLEKNSILFGYSNFSPKRTRMRETILYLRTCNAGTKEQCHIRTPFMIMLIQLNNNNINHLIPQFSLCCHHFLKIFLSVLLTGAIIAFFFCTVVRRIKRAKELDVVSGLKNELEKHLLNLNVSCFSMAPGKGV
ncbi:hypothetical protein Ahy_A10g050173 isoform E [Arachis hypogaea]|uniref:Uncharacterized protein n=1 Tax=Arachis hypogaea TaxID=3818 RepID=A0A445B8R6_ARAHY|nr:hypothetical protein Ahy_A10g050173 isoform E [Arachis hypogaea]